VLVIGFLYMESESDSRECSEGARTKETERGTSVWVESDKSYVVCSSGMGAEIEWVFFLNFSGVVGFAEASNDFFVSAVPGVGCVSTHCFRRSRSSRALLRSVRPRRPKTVSLQHHKKKTK
jgi:hypothetical protein